MTPLIGVTTYGRREKYVDNPPDVDHFCVAATYVDAIRRAGGAAVVLPGAERHIDRWLDALDGIVFSGGGDLAPALYSGDTAHAKVGKIHADRDQAEIDLTHAILKHGRIPTLFICRGLQVLNVAMGGTLHEHLPDLGQPEIHTSQTDDFWGRHEVQVQSGTLLAKAIGRGTMKTLSAHHQAIKALAPGLRVSALAEDGIIEALEVEGHPFALGVQWHPEAGVADDPDQLHIFQALVAAASAGNGTIR